MQRLAELSVDRSSSLELPFMVQTVTDVSRVEGDAR